MGFYDTVCMNPSIKHDPTNQEGKIYLKDEDRAKKQGRQDKAEKDT